jgi:hypothetical protein
MRGDTTRAGRASPEVRAWESTAADDAPYYAPASPPPRSARRSGATTPPCPSPGPACPSASARPWPPPAAPTAPQCPAPTWRTRGRPPRSRTPRRSPRGCAPRAAAWRRAASPGAARSALILRTLRGKGEGGREGRWRPVPSVGGLPFALPTREGVSRPRSPADCRMELALLPTPVLPSVRADAALAELTSAISPREKMCKRVLFDGALPRETQAAARDAGACGATRTCTRPGNGRRDGGARSACSEEGENVVCVFFSVRSVCLVPGATRRVQPTSHRPRPLGQDVPVHLISQTPKKHACAAAGRHHPSPSQVSLLRHLCFHTPLEGCDLSTPALFFSARPAPNALPNLKDAGLRKGNGENGEV